MYWILREKWVGEVFEGGKLSEQTPSRSLPKGRNLATVLDTKVNKTQINPQLNNE